MGMYINIAGIELKDLVEMKGVLLDYKEHCSHPTSIIFNYRQEDHFKVLLLRKLTEGISKGEFLFLLNLWLEAIRLFENHPFEHWAVPHMLI